VIALESFSRWRVAGIKNTVVSSSAYTSMIDCLENKADIVVVYAQLIAYQLEYLSRSFSEAE